MQVQLSSVLRCLPVSLQPPLVVPFPPIRSPPLFPFVEHYSRVWRRGEEKKQETWRGGGEAAAFTAGFRFSREGKREQVKGGGGGCKTEWGNGGWRATSSIKGGGGIGKLLVHRALNRSRLGGKREVVGPFLYLYVNQRPFFRQKWRFSGGKRWRRWGKRKGGGGKPVVAFLETAPRIRKRERERAK